MGRITGSNAYFIGNVRDNSIHIYDHEDALHLNYRISGCMVVPGSGVICKSCWTPKYESAAAFWGSCLLLLCFKEYGKTAAGRLDAHQENKVRKRYGPSDTACLHHLYRLPFDYREEPAFLYDLTDSLEIEIAGVLTWSSREFDEDIGLHPRLRQ